MLEKARSALAQAAEVSVIAYFALLSNWADG
jgi:hypothetical protein